jgi:hypothetical protein
MDNKLYTTINDHPRGKVAARDSRSHQTLVGEEDFAPDDDLIPQTEVDETKNKLGRVMRLMRTELIPITENTSQETNYNREFWWESS